MADAASGYSTFLRQLVAERDPLQRPVLITHRAGDPAAATRAAAHTVRALAATGAVARVLDATTVIDLLYAAADP